MRFWLMLLVALSGCVPSRLDPAGDYPDAGPGNVRAPSPVVPVSGMGVLWVRTHEEPPSGSDGRAASSVPTAFWVFDDRGDLVAPRVIAQTTLVAGRYLVWQENAPDFPQTFRVTLREGEVSAVDPRFLRRRP